MAVSLTRVFSSIAYKVAQRYKKRVNKGSNKLKISFEAMNTINLGKDSEVFHPFLITFVPNLG
jgi:hypothetical protein